MKNKLQLSNWDIDIQVSEVPHEDDLTDDAHTQAIIRSCLYEYSAARIIVYCNTIINRKELKSVLLHELFHLVVNPLSMVFEELCNDRRIKNLNKGDLNNAVKVEEIVVTKLTNIFKNL